MRQSLSFFARITVLCISLIFIIPCGEDNAVKQIPIINFEERVQYGTTLNLSDYCSDIEYIPLQTDTASLIGNMSGSLFTASSDFLYCAEYNSQNCKVFDTKGNFIRTIGNKGRAPGEYTTIGGISINRDNSTICISDMNKIVVYNNEGKFIKEIKFDKAKDSLEMVMGGAYIGTNRYSVNVHSFKSGSSGLAILDENGELVFKYKEPEVKKESSSGINADGSVMMRVIEISRAYMLGDNIISLTPNNDTIFAFSNKFDKKPLFVRNLGKYKLAADQSNTEDAMMIMLNQTSETQNHIFFKIRKPFNLALPYANTKNMWISAIYNKQNNQLDFITNNPNFNTTGLNNNIDNGAPFWPAAIIGNKMYQFINAMDFMEMSEKSGSVKMKEIASKLTDESNPVIIVATLK